MARECGTKYNTKFIVHKEILYTAGGLDEKDIRDE